MLLQRRAGSGDAGVLSDKVRWVAAAAATARAECVNEGIPFYPQKLSAAVSKSSFPNFVVEKDITWVINFFRNLRSYLKLISILWLLKTLGPSDLGQHMHMNIKVSQNQLKLCENYFLGEITTILMINRCVDQDGSDIKLFTCCFDNVLEFKMFCSTVLIVLTKFVSDSLPGC
jgi:hypothetical protein